MAAGTNIQDRYRELPQLDRLLETGALKGAAARHGRALVAEVLRGVLAEARAAIAAGGAAPTDLVPPALAALEDLMAPRLRPAINATGIVIHTGLGRAPLAASACRALAERAGSYVTLEIDGEGRRSQRHLAVRDLLVRLTGAPAALVVNNNAAANLLALTALARGREVVVSHGELVEIGGGFRIPEVLAESGAILRAVGTTNRTRLADYETAIGPATAVLLKVHRSNFRLVGFTEDTPLADIAELARRRDLVAISDLGSGSLQADLGAAAGEPTMAAQIADGADLVCSSGDKLLGGPQCGILAGRSDIIDRCARHPLYRALRPGRLTLIALEETLKLHLDPDLARREIPVLADLERPLDDLRRESSELARAIDKALPALQVEVVFDHSLAGGGALPDERLPTQVVRLRPRAGQSIESLARALRQHDPPIYARIQDDAVLLDPRTLRPRDTDEIIRALARRPGTHRRGPPAPDRALQAGHDPLGHHPALDG